MTLPSSLDEAPAAWWSDAPGVVTDCDDTLTTHGTLVSPALRALEALASLGVPCIIATGRPIGWAEVLAHMLPVRAVVAENGGAWVVRESSGLRVAFEPIEASAMARVQHTVDRLEREIPGLRRVEERTRRLTDVTLDVGERVTLPRADIDRALTLARAEGLHAIASTVHLHVSARAPDKMGGVRVAARDLGVDPAEVEARWIYVGDSPNDAGPFAAMARTVGVANVMRFEGRMPAWPKHVTRAEGGAGFAEVIDRLCRGRA